MNAALAQARGFPHPVVTGSARVAGRDTAVIDLGVTTCPSNAAGAYNGDTTVWIDKETFFFSREWSARPTASAWR